jgi:hypothetical protein
MKTQNVHQFPKVSTPPLRNMYQPHPRASGGPASHPAMERHAQAVRAPRLAKGMR